MLVIIAIYYFYRLLLINEVFFLVSCFIFVLFLLWNYVDFFKIFLNILSFKNINDNLLKLLDKF